MSKPSGDPDRPDWIRHREGDDQAYLRLDDRHREAVMADLVRRKMKDPEDSAQKAFIDEYYSRPKPVEGTASFRSFMTVKARWISIKEFHRTKRQVLNSESGTEEGGQGILETSTNHQHVLAALVADQGEMVGRIRWGFPELKEKEVTHIYLRLMDLNSTEIAGFLETTAANERTLWVRLRRKVKELYEVDLDSILG
jgi:hypothetical protein